MGRALGVTGARLDRETGIWEEERGDRLRSVWHEVKKFCQFFYALKPLLGDRLVVTDHAITKSIDPIDASSLLRQRSRVDVESEEVEDDETGIAMDPALQTSTRARHAVSAPVTHPVDHSTIAVLPVGPLARLFLLLVLPPWLLLLLVFPAPVAPLAETDNPRPEPGLRRDKGEFADFAENIKGIMEAANVLKALKEIPIRLGRFKIQK